MKIKNVNFIERHVEKIILGVGLACAGWVLVTNVLLDPYHLTATNGDAVYPDDVEKKLKDKALSLESGVNNPSSGLPNIPVPEYTKSFEQLANSTPPSPRPGLTYWWATPGLDPMLFAPNDSGPQNPVYIVPPVPAAEDITARADFAKLSKNIDPAQLESLTKLTGATGPGDFFYVTVSGVYDFNKWREAITKTQPEQQRIKEEWYRNSYQVTYVQLYRCEWDEEKQDWTVAEPVAMLPGNPDFTNTPSTFSDVDGQNLLREIRLNRRLIMEPPFLPVDQRRPWGLVSSFEIAARLKQINTDLADAQKRYEALTRDASGKIVRPSGKALAESNELAARINMLKDDLEKVKQSGSGASTESAGLNMTPRVWAHDVTVKSGKKYRYQMRVGILNPLFQRGQMLRPAQKIMYNNKVSLEPDTKANDKWIEVTVPKNHHYFILTTQKSENAVDVESWRVFNAGWFRQVFSVQPGDAIGQVVDTQVDDKPFQVDLKTNYTLVDLFFPGQSAGTTGQMAQAVLVSPKDVLMQVAVPVEGQNQAPVVDPIRAKLLQEVGVSADAEKEKETKGAGASAPAPAQPQPGASAPAPGPAKPPAGTKPPAPPTGPGGAGPAGPGAVGQPGNPAAAGQPRH